MRNQKELKGSSIRRDKGEKLRGGFNKRLGSDTVRETSFDGLWERVSGGYAHRAHRESFELTRVFGVCGESSLGGAATVNFSERGFARLATNE